MIYNSNALSSCVSRTGLTLLKIPLPITPRKRLTLHKRTKRTHSMFITTTKRQKLHLILNQNPHSRLLILLRPLCLRPYITT